MLFSLLKYYLDTALKVSQSVYGFTISISHGIENYFPRLWGTGTSDAIFINYYYYLDLYITDTALKVSQSVYCFTISISHSVEKYFFLRLWGMGISDAIFIE